MPSTAGLNHATATPSWLEIDLARLGRNVHALRELLGGSDAPAATTGDESKNEDFSNHPRLRPETPDARPRTLLCGVIKKNAYGLGATTIAHRLSKAGCDMLAVYSAEEAEQLIRDSVETTILLLMPLRTIGRTDALYRAAVAGRLHLTIHDVEQLQQLNDLGRTFGMRLPVHLFVDTGMSRSGLNEEQLHHVLAALPTMRSIRPVGICSHLASADEDAEFTEQQRQRFEAIVEEARAALPDDAIQHLANTFGTLRDPRLRLDMVRCGLGLLGYGGETSPNAKPNTKKKKKGPKRAPLPELQPVVRWLSRVIHVQRYSAGASVGYGATHTLERDSVLGIVPVGYGDGYPLGLGNKAHVRLLDEAGAVIGDCRVLGRVNMDQIVIDLTDCAQGDTGALVDHHVEVISSDPDAPNALPRLAELAGLHCYAMLCRLSPHLPRQYAR